MACRADAAGTYKWKRWERRLTNEMRSQKRNINNIRLKELRRIWTNFDQSSVWDRFGPSCWICCRTPNSLRSNRVDPKTANWTRKGKIIIFASKCSVWCVGQKSATSFPQMECIFRTRDTKNKNKNKMWVSAHAKVHVQCVQRQCTMVVTCEHWCARAGARATPLCKCEWPIMLFNVMFFRFQSCECVQWAHTAIVIIIAPPSPVTIMTHGKHWALVAHPNGGKTK